MTCTRNFATIAKDGDPSMNVTVTMIQDALSIQNKIKSVQMGIRNHILLLAEDTWMALILKKAKTSDG